MTEGSCDDAMSMGVFDSKSDPHTYHWYIWWASAAPMHSTKKNNLHFTVLGADRAKITL
jgi:hypothetical protein